MAIVGRYRVKRQRRWQLARGSRAGRGRLAVEAAGARFVPVGTVGALGLGGGVVAPASGVSVWIHGRYEVRVGLGFEESTLARVVRVLERLG